MKYRWDKKYLYQGVTAFCVIAGSILFYVCLTNMAGVAALITNVAGFFTPVIYGFVFAYLLSPVMNYFEKKVFRKLFNKIEKKRITKGKTRTSETARAHELKIKRKSRALGVLTTVLLALGLLVGLISAVIPQVFESVTALINNTNVYVAAVQNWDLSFLNVFPDVQAGIYEFMHNAPTIVSGWLQEHVQPEMADIVGSVTGGIWSTLSALINILIGLVVSIYLLHGKELFAAQIKKTLYAVLSIGNANVIIRNMRSIHQKFGGFITGKLIECLIIGAICFVIMTVMNMPYKTLVSVIIGVTNFIPVFGPFIGAIPSTLLILMASPIKALYFIIIIMIIQQIDGLWLGPKILGENTGLSSFWVIFAIVVGQRMFGFIGLVVGIPLFSFIYALIKTRITLKLKQKELPTDSDFYRAVSHLDKDTGDFILFNENEKTKIKKEKKKPFG